ncbi:hypothetical protein FLONG3_10121, partial [Fusarium longipes]
PPPKAPEVPPGWAVRWNDQYKEWFYVNIYTKQSQWDKPTAPVFPHDDGAPAGPPPGYEPGNTPIVTDTKKNPYEDVTASAGGSSQDEDAKLAARLQAEEDARARSGPGGPDVPAGYGGSNSPYPQSNSPYPQQQGGSSYPSELPPRERGAKSGGFLGKLLSKGKQMAEKQQHQQQGGYGGYGGASGGMGGGYPQQQYYPQQSQGGYPGHGPPMGYGAQPHYGGGYGAPGGYGGYGGGPGYGQPGGGFGGGGMGGGRRPGGGGMGMAGGAALGAGAGLLGGAMLMNAFDNDEQEAYQDGFEDGADFDGGD